MKMNLFILYTYKNILFNFYFKIYYLININFNLWKKKKNSLNNFYFIFFSEIIVLNLKIYNKKW